MSNRLGSKSAVKSPKGKGNAASVSSKKSANSEGSKISKISNLMMNAASTNVSDVNDDNCQRPPFDFRSMTDDRWMAAMMQCSPPICMPTGCVKPEAFYTCDRQVAKLLAHYVSPEEREKVMLWLDAIHQLTQDVDELSERSLYLTCLVMLLKSGQLIPPFTRTPPMRPFKSLRDVIDRHLFKMVQVECRKRRVYDVAKYEHPDRSVSQRPPDFYDQMPTPYTGIYCYGAAFSST